MEYGYSAGWFIEAEESEAEENEAGFEAYSSWGERFPEENYKVENDTEE